MAEDVVDANPKDSWVVWTGERGRRGVVMIAVMVVIAVRIIRDRSVRHCGEKRQVEFKISHGPNDHKTIPNPNLASLLANYAEGKSESFRVLFHSHCSM